jgi:hypothetical protein
MTRLTTVAAFDGVAKAEAARAVLEAAGIPAELTDSEIVAAEWLIWNAVGGVQVQVREEDAERAAEVLADEFGEEAGLVSEEVGEDELTRQALAESSEESEDEPEDR